MIRALLIAALLCSGCRTTRVALAPNTARAQVLVAEQQAEVAKAAANLTEQVKKLERVQSRDERALELSQYIQGKADILIRDYRSKQQRIPSPPET